MPFRTLSTSFFFVFLQPIMVRSVLYIIWMGLALLLSTPLQAHEAPKKFTVVIDAGHGGNDPGAVGKKAKEKTINLNTALKLGQLIEKNCPDVKVIYTRKTDVFVALQQRAQIANNAKADLFISIHTNALPKGKIATGAETYTLGMARAGENLEVAKKENSVILMEKGYKETYKGFNPNSSESYIIFEFMQDKNMSQSINFARKVQQQFKKAGRVDKGVHQAGFLVLRETVMPSVLVELGYISTPAEESFLNTSAGTDKMAQGIYEAFLSYRKNVNTSGNTVTDAAPIVAESAVKTDNEVMELHPIKDASHVARGNKTTAKATSSKTTATATEKTAARTETAVKTEPATKTEPVAKAVTATTRIDEAAPVFKIQILTSLTKLSTSDRQFKGLKGVEYYRDSNKYKYTYGASNDYNEVLRKKKEINSKFADCFIIAFRNGEKMDVNEAIRIFKNSKK